MGNFWCILVAMQTTEGVIVIEQLKTIREFVDRVPHETSCALRHHADNFCDCGKQETLTALTQLEAMVGEQKPCGWYDDGRVFLHEGKLPPNGADLYAAPIAQQPQAEAVPLDADGRPQVQATIEAMNKMATAAGIPPYSHIQRLLAAKSASQQAEAVSPTPCQNCGGRGELTVGMSGWPPRMRVAQCESCNGSGHAAVAQQKGN